MLWNIAHDKGKRNSTRLLRDNSCSLKPSRRKCSSSPVFRISLGEMHREVGHWYENAWRCWFVIPGGFTPSCLATNKYSWLGNLDSSRAGCSRRGCDALHAARTKCSSVLSHSSLTFIICVWCISYRPKYRNSGLRPLHISPSRAILGRMIFVRV